MSTMRRVSSLVSADIGNYLTNKQTWGDIIINVKSYGAKGDGETDDTANIQEAIDDAISINKTEIVFPAGIYLYTTLTNTIGMTFIGDGVTLTGDTPLVLTSSTTLSLINTNKFLNFIKSAESGILIGDSITVGYNAAGAGPDPSGRIIFDNGTDVYREGKYSPDAWANYLRRFCLTANPDIDIINAGIDGSSIRFANQNKTYRITDDVDFCFIALGTNDFHYGYTADDFKTNYTEFVQYAKTKSKMIICVSPIPRIDSITGQFTIAECESMISDIALSEGCVFIPMYQMWLSYFDSNNLNISNFMTAEGIHPNDAGHLVMWKLYQKFFNFSDVQTQYSLYGENSPLPIFEENDSRFNSSTANTEYPLGISILPLSISNTFGLPDGKTAGSIVTIKSTVFSGFTYQYFYDASSDAIYFRLFSFVTNDWTNFINLSNSKSSLTLQNSWTARPSTVPAVSKVGNTVHVCFSITGGTLSVNTTLFTLPTGFRPTSTVEFMLTNTNGTTTVAIFGFVDTSGAVKLGVAATYSNILMGNFSFVL